mgnify:CR=1 FL=1
MRGSVCARARGAHIVGKGERGCCVGRGEGIVVFRGFRSYPALGGRSVKVRKRKGGKELGVNG